MVNIKKEEEDNILREIRVIKDYIILEAETKQKKKGEKKIKKVVPKIEPKVEIELAAELQRPELARGQPVVDIDTVAVDPKVELAAELQRPELARGQPVSVDKPKLFCFGKNRRNNKTKTLFGV